MSATPLLPVALAMITSLCGDHVVSLSGGQSSLQLILSHPDKFRKAPESHDHSLVTRALVRLTGQQNTVDQDHVLTFRTELLEERIISDSNPLPGVIHAAPSSPELKDFVDRLYGFRDRLADRLKALPDNDFHFLRVPTDSTPLPESVSIARCTVLLI
jgi:hypothetical protein